MKRGILITFEGGEGSGKSTQIRMLASHLKRRGHSVLVTCEPGGSLLGKQIRRMLLHAPHRPSKTAELFLFLADRADHVESILRPTLKRGQTVLCDRYTDSTLAYQGGGRGFPLRTLEALNRAATGGLTPDLTFLLDVPVEVGLARAGKRSKGRKDRMERERLNFHRAVRSTFLRLAGREPRRFRVIDGHRNPNVIHQEVWNAVPLGK